MWKKSFLMLFLMLFSNVVINMLDVDEDESLNIVHLEDYTMIRTGVMGDGSCFFHSLFTSMNEREFKRIDRKNYIKQQREMLSSLSIDQWLSLSDGNIAFLQYDQLAKKMKYRLVTDNPNVMKKMNDTHIFPKELVNQEILDKAYETYKKKLKNTRECITHIYVKYIMDYYKVNILFINEDGTFRSSGRQDCRDMERNGYPFVLMYYIDEAHFESIGRIEDGHRVRRLFSPKDKMIVDFLRHC